MVKINWKEHCKGCGECCGIVPIPYKTWDKFRNKIQNEPIYVFDDSDNKVIIPITADYSCIFLNPIRECAIYKDRPDVCKLYGTIDKLKCPKFNGE